MNTFTRLFLIRHGESTWNAAGRIQGQSDPPLSERGVSQAYALATVFRARPLSGVYSSPLKRARTTAEYIAAPHKLTPCIVTVLQESHLGCWQGRYYDDLDTVTCTDTPESTLVTPLDGETIHEVQDRVGPKIDAMVETHRGTSLAIVTHSIIGRVILCYLMKADLELVPRLKLKQASITMLRLDEDGVVLESLGDVSHLGSLAVRSYTASPQSNARQQVQANGRVLPGGHA